MFCMCIRSGSPHNVVHFLVYLAVAKSLMIKSLAMTVLPAVTSTEALTGFQHVGHIKAPSL